MKWNNEIDLMERQYTARLIIERSLLRGWKVGGFESNPAILFIYPKPDGKPVKIFSSLTPDTSFVASKIAKDKHITSELLHAAGLPVPDEIFLDKYHQLADSVAADFLSKHPRAVVKPLDSAHGKGITVGVKDISRLSQAIEIAKTASPSQKVLIQEELHGHDIRIVTVGYKFFESMSRVPPHVIGDGQKTVRELIQLENLHQDRGETYKSKLAFIPLDKVEAFLGIDVLDSVPLADEEIQVMGISNIGTGGTRINTKNSVPEFLKDMAIKAAEAMELPVCGVDFIVKALPTPDSTPEELQAKVIEVNSCPSLTHYEDVRSAGQLEAIDKYLDYIESMG